MFICRACARRTRPSFLRGPHAGETTAAAAVAATATIRHAPRRSAFTAAVSAPALAPVDGLEDSHLTRAERDSLEWAVKQQLRYLKNPYKIAQYVETALAKGRFDEALLLTRKASKDASLTVAWNFLMQHQFRGQKLHAAIKLFNEMKKRAQIPTAQTYTLVFKGCANSIHPKLAVSEAMRIYYSMMNSASIKPNTIHMNAVLQVCARAGDLESMFNIVKTADSKLRSPDNWTYTMILNALGFKAKAARRLQVEDAGAEPPGKQEAQVTIARAKAIWEEVMTRWRQGLIVVDETLVCAMGRVLSLGGYQDLDDILLLVEQTMNISRPDSPEPAALSGPRGVALKPDASQSPAAGAPKAATAPESRAVVASKSPSAIYVAPGANTLSLVLVALLKLRKSNLGLKYWDVFQALGVEPDSENWFSLLRVLRASHASAKMAEMLQKMPPEFMQPKTFQIAMAACAKDTLNEHVFANAGKIMDLMSRHLRVPDPSAMRLYLRTVLLSTRRFQQQADKGDVAGAKLAKGRHILRGLDRLWEPLRLSTNSLSYPAKRYKSREEELADTRDFHHELIALAREMVSASDRIVSENLASPEAVKITQMRRNVLNRHITRLSARQGQLEPNLDEEEYEEEDVRTRYP